MTEFTDEFLSFLYGEDYEVYKPALEELWDDIYKRVVVKTGDYYENGMTDSYGIIIYMLWHNYAIANSHMFLHAATQFLLRGTVTPQQLRNIGGSDGLIQNAVESADTLESFGLTIPGILSLSLRQLSPESLMEDGMSEADARSTCACAQFLRASCEFRHGFKTARELESAGLEFYILDRVLGLCDADPETELLRHSLKTARDLMEEGRSPAAVAVALAEAGEQEEYEMLQNLFSIYMGTGRRADDETDD